MGLHSRAPPRRRDDKNRPPEDNNMNNSLAGNPLTLFKDEVRAPVVVARSRKVYDPVGMWYAARHRFGYDDRIWFALYEHNRPNPQWHTCLHRNCDGLGAVALTLRERGYGDVHLPQSRETRIPDWRTLWQARRTTPPSVVDMQWRWLEPSLKNCGSHAPVSMLLDTDQTLAIEEAAAAAGVSSTVWLLWTADRALRATLASPDSVSGWIYPVNLRGAVRAADEFANHCSGLVLTLDRDGDAEDCKLQIRERFAHHEHWRQWVLLTLGRWIGQRGINLLYRISQSAPGRYAGSYSNLGEWNVPGIEGLAVTAPGSPAYPVAVGTVLCNGRRTLSCRLHPVIGGNPGCAIEFVKIWREFSVRAPVKRVS
jgi:hypothetical protein